MIPDGMAFDAGVSNRAFMLRQINAKAATILSKLWATTAALICPAAERVAELAGVEVGLAQQKLEPDGGQHDGVAGELGAQCGEVW